MNCLKCGVKNSSTVTYCQKCGAKLDLTPDDIQDAMIEKAQTERRKTNEHQARQALFFAVILFLAAVTSFAFSGGAETDVYSVPSSAGGAKYVSVEYSVSESLKLPKALIPLTVKKP